MTAWANVSELASTAPVDITVDGYTGKQIEFTVPDYARAVHRSRGPLRRLEQHREPRAIRAERSSGGPPRRYRHPPTNTSRCWSSTSTAPGC